MMIRQSITKSLMRFLGAATALLDKLLYIVVDRRALILFFTLLFMIFGMPEIEERANLLSDQLAGVLILAGQILTALLGVIKLIDSWEKREPSGLWFNQARMERAAARLLEREIGKM